MMAVGKETAEQKLLKMIESSSEGDSLSTTKTQRSSSGEGALASVRISNKVLFLALLVAAFFLFNEFKNSANIAKPNIQISMSTASKKNRTKEDLDPTSQRVSYYMAGISSRNIFEPYVQAKINNVIELKDETAEIADKTRALKLVGISWMDRVNTASVMIEDTAKGITYFLQKNDKIDDIVVKTIYAESVELGYENEEIIISYD